MVTQYQRGRDVEYAAQEKLQKAGWHAQRAPSSKGPADVLAVRRADPWLIGDQADEGDGVAVVAFVNCKRTITDCPPDDWNKTWFAAAAVGAIPLVAGRFRGVRGVKFMRMLGPKEPGRTDLKQPWEPFSIGGET